MRVVRHRFQDDDPRVHLGDAGPGVRRLIVATEAPAKAPAGVHGDIGVVAVGGAGQGRKLAQTSRPVPAMITLLRPVWVIAWCTRLSCQALISVRSMISWPAKVSVSSGSCGPFGPAAGAVVNTAGMPSSRADRARASTLARVCCGSRIRLNKPSC